MTVNADAAPAAVEANSSSSPRTPVTGVSIPEKGVDSDTVPQRKPKCVVKGKDMPDEMANTAIEVAVSALDRFELERDMAQYVKQEFDKRYQPTWHCIVGRHFGSYVSHESNGFIYFYIDKLAVLLFRSGDSV